MEKFNPKSFVDTKISELRKTIGDEHVLVAVSGGVDSTTCAVLTHKAIGGNLVCVILDDAFMRMGEPEYVAQILSRSPFNVQTKVIDVRDRFLEAMRRLKDAEEKRKRFQATFYQVLGEIAKEEDCDTIIQGTIQADIDETVSGVKTQHNVLQQMGINPMERFGFNVVEPLVSLYKGQVRMVARFLGLPSEFSERQPFPGPGLSVRVVGEIHPDKLETVKKATAIVEGELAQYKPSQYFAVIIDQKELSWQSSVNQINPIVVQILDTPLRYIKVRIFKDKATGVKEGERRYGQILGIKASTRNGRIRSMLMKNLIRLQDKIITENPSVTRCLYAIRELDEEKLYVIGIRAVETENFLTAQISEVPWTALVETAELVIEKCPNVSGVYYDITPKPPATIEME